MLEIFGAGPMNFQAGKKLGCFIKQIESLCCFHILSM